MIRTFKCIILRIYVYQQTRSFALLVNIQTTICGGRYETDTCFHQSIMADILCGLLMLNSRMSLELLFGLCVMYY